MSQQEVLWQATPCGVNHSGLQLCGAGLQLNNAAGAPVSLFDDQGSQLWRFVRGPLPRKNLPVKDGSELSPWIVAYI